MPGELSYYMLTQRKLIANEPPRSRYKVEGDGATIYLTVRGISIESNG
jgi:hypothetical protein